ncbi:hypothetical protein GCM10023063_48580 [Arthrobacter methylotrophus]|uniref:hypothetical protein n=1 Tax=Arthrobacter methylotrophus TaxID=121291 RepID=UPI0031E6A5AA
MTLNAIIADALSNGAALAVVDDVSKAIDFEWARSFCRPEAGAVTPGSIRRNAWADP